MWSWLKGIWDSTWNWLGIENNRGRVLLFVALFLACIGGGWEVFTYLFPRPESEQVTRREVEKDVIIKQFFEALREKSPNFAQELTADELHKLVQNHLRHHKAVESEIRIYSDPQIASLKKQASEAAGLGEYERADKLLATAYQKARKAGEKAQSLRDQHLLSAAESAAQRGDLYYLQFDFHNAIVHYKTAIEVLPGGFDEIKVSYLATLANLYGLAENYHDAEWSWRDFLGIWRTIARENELAMPLVALGSERVALTLVAQGEYPEAKKMMERAWIAYRIPVMFFLPVGRKASFGSTLSEDVLGYLSSARRA